MKRKTSTTPTRIYNYGALPPITNRALFESQLKAAHRYMNALIEIEQWRRKEVDAVLRKFGDVGSLATRVEELLTELSSAREALKRKRAGDGKRAETSAETRTVKAIGAELRAARLALKAEKQRIKEVDGPARQAALEVVNEASREKIRAARKASGVYWGTYLQVEKAMEASRKAVAPPFFRRYDGTGKIAVQIQHGMTVAELFSCEDTRLRVSPVPEDTFALRRHHRRIASRTLVDIRASSDGMKPIFVRVPIVLHRPLPPDAVIKEAWILRRRVGFRFRHRFQIVIESNTFAAPAARIDGGTIAIDIGWRRKPDGGLRMMYWSDTRGGRGEILVPTRTVEGVAKADEIRSTRGNLFDEMQARVLIGRRLDTSAWFQAATAFAHQWRSPKSLVRLLGAIRIARENGDPISDDAAELESELIAWAKQDRHLWSWEGHQRERRLNHRNDVWRNEAVRIAKTYRRIIVELFDLTVFAESPQPEEGFPSDDKLQRRMARLASSGIFRSYLEQAAKKYGAEYVERPAAYTTLRCHLCGNEEKWDARPRIEHTCSNPKCGKTWDQDFNATMNLRADLDGPASGDVPPKEPGPLAPDKPSTVKDVSGDSGATRKAKTARKRDRSQTVLEA